MVARIERRSPSTPPPREQLEEPKRELDEQAELWRAAADSRQLSPVARAEPETDGAGEAPADDVREGDEAESVPEEARSEMRRLLPRPW